MSVKPKWVKKRAKPITGFKKFLDNNNLLMYPISYHNFFKALTKSIRIKPTYLIIGASRSGTTAMYDYLSKNRYGYRSPHKELHFFDKYFHKGFLWYRGNFPTIFHKFYLEKILHKKKLGKLLSVYYQNFIGDSFYNPFDYFRHDKNYRKKNNLDSNFNSLQSNRLEI